MSSLPSKVSKVSKVSKFSLATYLDRVNIKIPPKAGLPVSMATLSLLMEAQMKAIPFENLDVVLGKTVSMAPEDVVRKLVYQKRGGYCFEHNVLMQCVLETVGFEVTPLLCRVRWGKPDDVVTTYTHMCLSVEGGDLDGPYLVDVGFAGTNSIQPIQISKKPQTKSDGVYRVVERNHYRYLQVQDRNDKKCWRSLYCWEIVNCCVYPDLECSNWYSCTSPNGRFTNQFFVARTLGNKDRYEKIHILNDVFSQRTVCAKTAKTAQTAQTAQTAKTTKIKTVEQLVGLLREHFGLELEDDLCTEDRLGRYLGLTGKTTNSKTRKRTMVPDATSKDAGTNVITKKSKTTNKKKTGTKTRTANTTVKTAPKKKSSKKSMFKKKQ